MKTSKEKTIANKDYANAPKKRELEKHNGNLIGRPGGSIMATTGPDIKSHLDDYREILRYKEDGFHAVEREKEIAKGISHTLTLLQRQKKYKDMNISLLQGDFFEELRKIHNLYPDKKWGYLHFDTTSTAETLKKERLLPNLRWVINTNILKNTAYLDITCSLRNSSEKICKELLEKNIPNIFKNAGYKVQGCPPPNSDSWRDKQWNSYLYYKTYNDTSSMATALYKLTKIRKKLK